MATSDYVDDDVEDARMIAWMITSILTCMMTTSGGIVGWRSLLAMRENTSYDVVNDVDNDVIFYLWWLLWVATSSI